MPNPARRKTSPLDRAKPGADRTGCNLISGVIGSYSFQKRLSAPTGWRTSTRRAFLARVATLSALRGYMMEMLDHERCRAPTNQDDTRDAREPRTPRGELLQKNDNRETRDPKHIHDPAHEQQRHQHPAASHAEGTMLDPHAQGAQPAEPPTPRQKLCRSAAMPAPRPLVLSS